MCVETHRTGLFEMIKRGHMLRFTLKMIWGLKSHVIFEGFLLSKWMFFHLSPWKPINVCWNPQNRAQFSETIDLRGHMPRFTLKMNVFPSICLETPLMCIETLRTGLVFTRQYDLRDHMSRFKSQNECFPIYLLGNPINVYWNQNLNDDGFEGSHA